MPEELILKQYDSEVKAVEGERALNVTITTNDVDRSGDIVEPKGAKLINFKKNPVVLMAHDYNGLPIGKAKDLTKTDNGITAKVIFPDEGTYPLADTVYNLYKQKYMKGWSIGFIPIKSEDIVDDEKGEKIGRGRRFKTWELLEFSACSVPNNPNTLTNMVEKGIDIKPLEEAGFIEIEDEEGKKIDEFIKEINKDDVKGAKVFLDKNENVEKIIIERELKDIITKPEETDDIIRIPAKGEEGKHKGHKIRWITVSAKEGIRGIYCIDCKKIITFVFDKKKGWTMEKAKKWMAEHGKAVCDYFEKVDWDVDYKIEEIDWEKVEASIEKDEKGEEEKTLFAKEKIGYSLDEIYQMVKDNKELIKKLEELELKAGAVLNAKNKSNLKNAQALIQSVLDSATTGEEEDSLEITDEKGEDNKKDDTDINLETDTADDPPIDEEKDKDKIEVDEKVIAKIVEKRMDYLVGKVHKSDT